MAWTKKTFVDNQTVIDATFLNGIQDELIKCIQPYSAGEKYPNKTAVLIRSGHITSGGKNIQFTVEFPRSIKNINTITFKGDDNIKGGTWIARGINGYVETSTNDKYFNDGTYNLSISKNDYTIFCSLSKSDGKVWNYTNGTEVANNGIIEVVLYGYFSFS